MGVVQAPQYCSRVQESDVLTPQRFDPGWGCRQPSMQVSHADPVLPLVSNPLHQLPTLGTTAQKMLHTVIPNF